MAAHTICRMLSARRFSEFSAHFWFGESPLAEWKKKAELQKARVLAQGCTSGTVLPTVILRRGGRAVDRAGLENRKAERPREFESHPLRQFRFSPPRLARQRDMFMRTYPT